MKRPVHALAFGLTLSLISSACFALGLEQRGQPDPQLNTMPNYGMEVPSRTALKSVVPAGWQLFVHQGVKLPQTMSWKMGDAWPKVLADLATTEGLSILIDWEGKTVLVRTEEVAVQERATREEINQAAVTPLPRFVGATSSKDEERLAQLEKRRTSAPVPAPAPVAAPAATSAAAQPPRVAEVVAQQAPDSTEAARMDQDAARRQHELAAQTLAESESTHRLPVIRTNPLPQMVAAQETAAQKRPAKLASTAEFSYTQPVALNKPPARKVAQAIATKYNLRLVWAAPELNLQGPVTLLAQSAQEDARLLQKALGVFSPIVLEVSENERVLRVLPRELAGSRRALPQVVAEALSQQSMAPSAPLSAPETAPAMAAPMAVAAMPQAAAKPAAAPAPKLVLSLNEHEPLEDALLRFVRAQGFTMEWKVAGGFEANRAMAFEGDTLVQVLSQLLPPLGVSADVYTRDKHIVIRPGEARDR